MAPTLDTLVRESAESRFRAVFGARRSPSARELAGAGNAWSLRAGDTINCRVATAGDGTPSMGYKRLKDGRDILRVAFAVIGGPHEGMLVPLIVLANPQFEHFRDIVKVVMGVDEVEGQSLASEALLSRLSDQDFEVELGAVKGALIIEKFLRVTAEHAR